MAEFEMFGPAAGGQRLAIKDQQEQALNQLAMQDRAMQTQERQAQIQQLQSVAQLNQAKLIQAQQQEERMARIRTEAAGKTFEQQAQLLANGGEYEEAGKLAHVAAQIANQRAAADAHVAQATKSRTEAAFKFFDTLPVMMERIQTSKDPQAAWQQMLGMVQATTGQPLPKQLMEAQFTPELADHISALGISWKDKVEAERKAAEDKSEKTSRELRDTTERLRHGLVKAQTAAAQSLADNRGKNEGPKARLAGAAPPGEVKLIKNTILAHYPEVDPTDPAFNAVAEAIGEVGRGLVETNRGMTWEMARSRAMERAVKEGWIAEGQEEQGWVGKTFGFTPKKVLQFKPPAEELGDVAKEPPAGKQPVITMGSSEANPIVVKDVTEYGKVKSGQFYQAPDGSVRRKK